MVAAKTIMQRADRGRQDAYQLVWQSQDERRKRIDTTDHRVAKRGSSEQGTASQEVYKIQQALKDCAVDVEDQGPCHPSFVPLNSVGEVINAVSLSKLLPLLNSTKKLSKQSRDELIETICGTLKGNHRQCFRNMVAILISIGKQDSIREIVLEGFSDDKAPLKLKKPGDQLTSHDDVVCHTTSRWERQERIAFWKECEKFNAPLFSRGKESQILNHYILSKDTVLPFVTKHVVDDVDCEVPTRLSLGTTKGEEEREIILRGEGGQGTVYRVQIHSSHYRFDDYSLAALPEGNINGKTDVPTTLNTSTQPQLFAVKELHLGTPREQFEGEVNAMMRFWRRRDKQFVKLLATYEIQAAKEGSSGTKFCLIFPCAEYSVRGFWRHHSVPASSSSDYLLWMAREFRAIADAICYMHEEHAREAAPDEKQYGRHGDIKPANFVVYKDPRSPQDIGYIFLADFGLCSWHRERSRSKIPARAASPSYEPPEANPISKQFLTRKYDIWCLGIFYLEFILWFLLGWSEIERFRDDRIGSSCRDGDDKFYELSKGPPRGFRLKTSVSGWFTKLHQHEHCTKFIHEMLDLIQHRMLIIEQSDRITAVELKAKTVLLASRSNDPGWFSVSTLTDQEYETNSDGYIMIEKDDPTARATL